MISDEQLSEWARGVWSAIRARDMNGYANPDERAILALVAEVRRLRAGLIALTQESAAR